MNVKTKTQLWIRDASQDRRPEIHPTLMREDFQRIMGQTNKDCRFRIFALTNSLLQQHLLVSQIRCKTEVCTCSQFPTEAMLWIKEVEMVESVDDLKSSRSNRGTPGPNFELHDARIASALNRIIQNTRFKKKRSVWRRELCRPICSCSSK